VKKVALAVVAMVSFAMSMFVCTEAAVITAARMSGSPKALTAIGPAISNTALTIALSYWINGSVLLFLAILALRGCLRE